MDATELKYDSACDSWVLEPIHGSNGRHRIAPTAEHRHSSAETFASSAASIRSSCASATPLRRSFSQKRWSPSPRYLTDLVKNDNGRMWKSLKHYWSCFKPSTDHSHGHSHSHGHHQAIMRTPRKEKRKIEPCGGNNASAKTNALSTYYAAMNAEERDENLRAVVLYCKNTSS